MGLKKFFKGINLSITYIILFNIALLALIFISSLHYAGNIVEGDVSLRSVYAPYDFRYPWGIDKEKTEESKERLRRATPLVFKVDDAVEEAQFNRLRVFFDGLSKLHASADRTARRAILDKLSEDTGLGIQESAVMFFAERRDRDKIRIDIIDILSSVYAEGIIDQATLPEDFRETRNIEIVNKSSNNERVMAAKEMPTLDKALVLCKEYATRVFSRDIRLRNYAFDLMGRLLKPNAFFDREETDRTAEDTIKAAKSIYNMQEVKKNEIVLERGQRITARHIAQLMQIGVIGGPTNKGPYFLGMVIFVCILSALGFLFMLIVDRKIVMPPKEVLLILLNSIFIIIAADFIIKSAYQSYLIPLAGVSMLIGILVGSTQALFLTIGLSIFFGVISGGKIDLSLVLFVGGVMGIYLVRDARRRSRIILAGLAAGAGQALTIISMGLVNNFGVQTVLTNSLWGLASGIVSIFLVMGFLPLFEYMFKITTNITLLELSDLNHPILKELTVKASGTYQHSIMVGNLAEAACESIGANSLLARVGSYYHDIGKIEKAEYFSENEMGAKSKHEKLTPSMSALIIMNHVKDGVEMARKYNINPKIIDFIREHHGTGLVYFFYHRALEKTDEGEGLSEEEFRYPGPKPQTKEVAIVLLADSVEASSRALVDPTPARIKGLVQKIVNNKFIDNQLDECDLTLKDLNKISEAFVHLLTAVFHTRIEYPEQADKPQKKGNGKN